MTKTSTRNSRGNDTTSPSKTRGPRHCRICPGRPLRSECLHTKPGREYLARKKELTSSPKTPRAPARCTTCEGRPLRSQCIHTPTGQAFLREQAILQELSQPSSQPEAAGTPPGVEQEQANLQDLSQPSSQPEAVSTPPGVERPSTLLSNDNESNRSPSPDGRNSVEPDASQGDINDLSPTDVDSVSASGFSTPRKTSNYIRPTKNNARYGWVQGAGRGAEEHKIFRHHALPDKISDQKTASKRFLENVNRLLEKCEDISNMTGCWLFLGVQHPSGLGSTIHYTSTRLARDAPKEIEAIAGDYHTLMVQLLQSRRTDALELQRQLQEVEARNKEILADHGVLAAKVDKMQQVLHDFAERLGVDQDALAALTSLQNGSQSSST